MKVLYSAARDSRRGVAEEDSDLSFEIEVRGRHAVADKNERGFDQRRLLAWDRGDFGGEVEGGCDLAVGGEDFDGGFVFVQVDLVHGDALEEGSVVAGGFEACGLELVGDVFCGAFVGFGAGVAAFHFVVGERYGLGPPGCGGRVGFLGGLGWGGEGQREQECCEKGAAHGCRFCLRRMMRF